MRTDHLARAVSQFVRVELMIAGLQLKAQVRGLMLSFVGLSITLFGIAMLNVAGYQWLILAYGPVMAPLGIAAVDVAVGIAITALSRTVHAGPELTVAHDLRKTLLSEIESDFLTKRADVPFATLPMRSAEVWLPIVFTLLRFLRNRHRSKPSQGG